MATIRRRNKKWQVQVRRLNYGSLNQSFNHKKDAEQWAREKEIELQQRSIQLKRVNFPTLKAIIDKYLQTVSIHKKGHSFERYCFNNILRSKVSNLPINFVTPQHLSEYRDVRLKEVKSATFLRELNLLRHLFSVAIVEWGFAITNPCKLIAKPNGIHKRERRLTDEEHNFLVKNNYPQQILKHIIELAIETGMRRGEILNIKSEHIKGQTLLISETKNGNPRTIPLTKRALYILKKTQLPFPMSANAVRLAWERLKKKGNIKNLHFHDLRHEAISRFFEKGLSIPEVALISGHKDVRMLFRYTHLKAEDILSKL